MNLKKSQLSVGNMMVYALVAVISIVSLIFGYKAIGMFLKSDCQASQLSFLNEFPSDITKMLGPSKFNSKKEFTYKSPCVDKIIITDSDSERKNTFAVLSSSEANTELIDQLLSDSQTENNIFMIKDSKIIKSLSIKN